MTVVIFSKCTKKGSAWDHFPQKKIFQLHIYILGVGWDGNLPHIYIFLKKCPIGTTLPPPLLEHSVNHCNTTEDCRDFGHLEE